MISWFCFKKFFSLDSRIYTIILALIRSPCWSVWVFTVPFQHNPILSSSRACLLRSMEVAFYNNILYICSDLSSLSHAWSSWFSRVVVRFLWVNSLHSLQNLLEGSCLFIWGLNMVISSIFIGLRWVVHLLYMILEFWI